MNSKKIFVFFLIVLSTFIPVCIYASEDDISTEKYYTANALYNKKLYKLAAEEFRNFLIRYPEHPKVNNAKLGLGLSYYELKKYSEAKPIFSELADKQNVPYQDQIHNLLGQCYLIENNPSQAEAAFRWSINSGKEKLYLDLPGVSRKSEESPQVPMGDIQSLEPLERSYAGLIEALFQQKKWEDVINYAKELKKNVPNSKYEDRVNFLSGLACYQLKKYAEAEKNLKPIVRKGVKIPFYAHALFLLAECQQHLGKLNDSAKNHEIIVKRVKGKFTDNSLFRLAYINYLQKNYNSAIRDFSDLRSIFPDSPYNSEAGIYLGKCFYKIKDYTKAQSVFGTLMDNKEVGAEAHLWLGKVFEEKEDYEKAIDVLTAGTKKYKDNPLRPKLMFELANAKMLAKDYTEAGSLLDKINRQYPENEIDNDSLKFQAFCYNRAGLYKKSNRACSLYLKKYPQSKEAVDIAFLKAENLFFQDKLDKAVKEFKKFIPVTGKEKYTYEAIYRLAQCYAEQKKWKHAYNETDTLIRNNIKGEFYNQLYYIAGISAYELGNWSKAIDYLKEYITVNTEYNNTDSALMKLALSYIKVNDYGNAEVILNKLIKTYPESRFMPYALNEAGKVYFKKNKFKKADKYFDRIIAQYPESEFVQQAEYYLGWIAFKESDEAEAAEYFKKISEKYPNSKLAGNSLLQLAVHQMRSGKYEKAEENLNKYLTVYSKDNKKKVEPLYYLYYCRSMNKKYDDIEDIFEPFIKKYPKSKFVPTAIYESAWRAKKLGNEKLAEKYYKEFLKKFPGHKLYNKVLFELAEDNYNRKEYDKAINKLDKLKASDLKPELEKQVLYRLAWALIGREQEDAALRVFKNLINKYPNSEFTVTSAYQVGEIYLKKKYYEKAFSFFNKAAEALGKDNSLAEQVLLRLGETQCLTDRWSDAVKTFRRVISNYSSSKYLSRAYMWLGWAQENSKDYTRAIKNYLKAISIKDDTEIAARSQFQIGECYFALEKYSQAIKAFVKVELNYNEPEWVSKALLEMAQVLQKTGEYKEALEILKKIVKKYPGSDEAITATELMDKSNSYIVNQ